MRRITVVLLVVSIVFASVEFSAAARGRGGGRSGGSRAGSSSRSRSKSPSKNGSSPKTTKHTPIKATKVSSPVIVSQTKQGWRSNTFAKALFGYVQCFDILLHCSGLPPRIPAQCTVATPPFH